MNYDYFTFILIPTKLGEAGANLGVGLYSSPFQSGSYYYELALDQVHKDLIHILFGGEMGGGGDGLQNTRIEFGNVYKINMVWYIISYNNVPVKLLKLCLMAVL